MMTVASADRSYMQAKGMSMGLHVCLLVGLNHAACLLRPCKAAAVAVGLAGQLSSNWAASHSPVSLFMYSHNSCIAVI
jgi:hypothetical protein